MKPKSNSAIKIYLFNQDYVQMYIFFSLSFPWLYFFSPIFVLTWRHKCFKSFFQAVFKFHHHPYCQAYYYQMEKLGLMIYFLKTTSHFEQWKRNIFQVFWMFFKSEKRKEFSHTHTHTHSLINSFSKTIFIFPKLSLVWHKVIK